MDELERERNLQRLIHSPTYRLAYLDGDFLTDPRMRAVRLELEFLKTEFLLRDSNIRSTIVVFGSTRIIEPERARRRLEDARAHLADTPDDPRRQRAVAVAERLAEKSRYYDMARQFARLVSEAGQRDGEHDWVVVTGGGPGVMEAANRGAHDVDAKSIGMNIRLPMEQAPNPYITPELCFQFNYFAIRKFHFLLRAKALVVFPGGFGTLDELFDALTLRQTQRMPEIPIILFGKDFWRRVIDFQFLADEGTIAESDLDLFRYAESAEQAWEMIQRYHRKYGKDAKSADY